MTRLLICCALLGLAACQKGQESTGGNDAAAAVEPGLSKGVDRSHKGKPAPDALFNDPDGSEISLAEFRGRPVLVNLWASWCAPCVKELPTLDRLAQSGAGQSKLRVVAVSQDMGPHASVEAFLSKTGITSLEAYHDPKMALSGALGVQVLPVSVLVDAEGREVWRYVGDLDWTAAEAAKLLAEAGGSVQG